MNTQKSPSSATNSAIADGPNQFVDTLQSMVHSIDEALKTNGYILSNRSRDLEDALGSVRNSTINTLGAEDQAKKIALIKVEFLELSKFNHFQNAAPQAPNLTYKLVLLNGSQRITNFKLKLPGNQQIEPVFKSLETAQRAVDHFVSILQHRHSSNQYEPPVIESPASNQRFEVITTMNRRS